MQGLRATINNKQLLFATTGDVVDISGGAEVVKGKWTAESLEKDNKIRYQLDGVGQPPVPAVYGFNRQNQLLVNVAGAGASTAFTYPGRIEVDSHHNFKYFVIDSTGTDTSAFFVLYGDIVFAESTVNLTIRLTGGGETAITGASGTQSLEAAKNHLAAFDADDLLTFHAKTVNTFAGQPDLITRPAILDFVGSWNVADSTADGTLVFLSHVKSSPGAPEVSLGFAGKFKAVTAGFVYFADAGGSRAVLNLRGQHVFKGGAGNLTWQTTIGFSETSFKAQVSVHGFVPLTSGQGLTMEGKLTLQGERNQSLILDLSLQARYEFQSGMLVFKADIANGIQPSYDLMLAGQFRYSNLNLSFQINYTNDQNASEISVAVGVQGNRDSMIKNLALMLNVTESEAKLKLDLTLEARIVLKNGVRVKEIPPLTMAAGSRGNV